VLHMAGWRDEAVIGAEAMPQKLPDMGVSDDTWLHNLGLTGGTAYFGLLRTAEAKEGETVFVSAAAGAVGSAVVQIAKLKGMRVIGSAGGPDKAAFVRELGAHACIDYKAGPVLPQLMAAAPDGIDVYFDNVGGEHLDAAFATARQWARFAICGMIDVYNDGKPQELKYIIRTIPTRLTMRGFIWTDYFPEIETFQREMGGWVTSGQIKAKTTVREGLEQALDAFLGLFQGANTGKMLVRL
jgi:NADPH-dependent curcumin reductase CurA